MKKLLFTLLLPITLFEITSCKKDAPKQPTPTIAGDTATNQPVAIQVSISPNPCSNQFMIQTNAQNSQLIQMFDVAGRKKISQFIHGSTVINTDSLTSGMYFIRITTSGGANTITKKLIVSK